MRTIIKKSGKEKPDLLRKKLAKLLEKKGQKKKNLSDFYGALPESYEDGLSYQRKVRNEWL